METATKHCPFCAETIQAAAIVCRYCGRDLPVQPAVPAAPRITQDAAGKAVCSACGGYVRADAASCKHCRVTFGVAPPAGAPASAVQVPQMPAPVGAQAKPNRTPMILGLIVLIIVGCVAISWLAQLGSPPGGGGGGADSFGAFFMCKKFVTDRLKAPATAVFPLSNGEGVQIVRLSAVQFRTSAYVDSQNGFGANVRTHYTCTVTNTGGDNWRLDDLTTD